MDMRSPLFDVDLIIYAGKTESMNNLKNWIHWRKNKKEINFSILSFWFYNFVLPEEQYFDERRSNYQKVSKSQSGEVETWKIKRTFNIHL